MKYGHVKARYEPPQQVALNDSAIFSSQSSINRAFESSLDMVTLESQDDEEKKRKKSIKSRKKDRGDEYDDDSSDSESSSVVCYCL